MKRAIVILMIVGLVLSLQSPLFAKAAALKIGSIQKYYSANNQYSVMIKILGYPDSSPSKCSFMKGEKIIWSKQIPTTPGKVNISNNGKAIVMANWGWYDEGGLNSLSFYNNTGELIKEVALGERKDGLWLGKAEISADGRLYVGMGSEYQKPFLFLYDTRAADLLWKKEVGFEHPAEIEISDKNDLILAAHFQPNSGDMLFSLLDINGNILWQKKINENLDWGVKDYLHFKDGSSNFEIFDKASGKYILFENKNGKIFEPRDMTRCHKYR